MGGLSAAALLARLGRRVLVLEQHRVPGGYTQSFRRGNWSWDVGLHVMGEIGGDALPGPLLDSLTEGRLAWTRVEDPYDVLELHEGPAVPIPGSLGGYRVSLEAVFPAERAAIREYFRLVRLAAAGMRDHFTTRILGRPRAHGADAARSALARRLALSRTAEVTGALTQNKHLRAALEGQWGFYGSPPHRSAFGVHALLCRHYRNGAFYPHGGAISIAKALAASLARGGGWLRVAAPVQEILVGHGRAMGVRLSEGEEILAPVVISAAGALNTVGLLPEIERRQEWVRSIEQLPPSCAHVCLNVGFRGDIRSAGATTTNHWLFASDLPGTWDLGTHPPSPYVSFPSLKDPLSAREAGYHTAEVVCLVDWESFARWGDTRWRKRPESYQALKDAVGRELLACLLRRFPALAPMVAYTELSTPLSAAHFVRAVRGASYGVEATPERFANPWLRPRVPVRGLFLAGSDVGVVGVIGALAGGTSAAIAVAPEPASEWIRGVYGKA
jgi:all-trans-retinol 13,14-reductase